MSDEPFGRQPQPVTVQLSGDSRDVDYWQRELMRKAEFMGDQAQLISCGAGVTVFKIYPRAVND